MSGGPGSIPVNVVTGFLGSGKTSLLQRLLRSPALARSAVLVNEFGEVGLDHHLLQRLDEGTVLLRSGCVCCTIRDDLKTAIRDLYARRERGEVPPFERLVIETTGLADPAPILATLAVDPVIRRHFLAAGTVAVVDAVNGARNLATYEESLKQAAAADRLVISKTDIAKPGAVRGLQRKLRRINPAAPQTLSTRDSPVEDGLLGGAIHAPAAHAEALDGHAHDADRSRHGDIRAFTLAHDEPLDWSAFALWLTMLLNRHGRRILRVKGLLDVAGAATPVVIHGVQHVIHPPTHLESWPEGDRRTRLTVIARGLAPEAVAASFAAFSRLAG